MVNAESGLTWRNEDDLVREMAGHIQGREGVASVGLLWVGNNAMFQRFLRVVAHDGRVYRLAISYVEDEEDVEGFDESFSRRST